MTKRTSKRTSKRMNSRTMIIYPIKKSASEPAPFVVDTYERKRTMQRDAATMTAAMSIARKHGRYDRPAIVWKLVRNKRFLGRKMGDHYRPVAVVVEGKTLR
jgi:hypothetical protein